MCVLKSCLLLTDTEAFSEPLTLPQLTLWSNSAHIQAYLLLQLFFRFSDPSHLRVGVNHRWHTIVIDVHSSAGHAFHADDALVLCFVSQHRTRNHITNSIDTARDHKKRVEDLKLWLLLSHTMVTTVHAELVQHQQV